MVELPFGKVTNTSAFSNFTEKADTFKEKKNFEKSLFKKEELILKSLFLTRVARLQYSFCNTTKNGLLTKFLEGAFKLTENFLEK